MRREQRSEVGSAVNGYSTVIIKAEQEMKWNQHTCDRPQVQAKLLNIAAALSELLCRPKFHALNRTD